MLSRPAAGGADGGAQSLQTLAAKSTARLRFNFRRKVTTGARGSGRAIARLGANTKEFFTGFGSDRTTNTNGYCGKNKNTRIEITGWLTLPLWKNTKYLSPREKRS